MCRSNGGPGPSKSFESKLNQGRGEKRGAKLIGGEKRGDAGRKKKSKTKKEARRIPWEE